MTVDIRVLVYVRVVHVSVIMCIIVWIHLHVYVALPMVVGASPMTGMLWQLYEYYSWSCIKNLTLRPRAVFTWNFAM